MTTYRRPAKSVPSQGGPGEADLEVLTVSRLRYSIYSPRAPRAYAGYLAGLLLAAVASVGFVMLGVVAPVVSHALFSALLAVTA